MMQNEKLKLGGKTFISTVLIGYLFEIKIKILYCNYYNYYNCNNCTWTLKSKLVAQFFSCVSPQLDFKFNHRIAIIAHGLACKNQRAKLIELFFSYVSPQLGSKFNRRVAISGSENEKLPLFNQAR